MSPLRLGLMVRPQGIRADELLGVFRLADKAGFDHVWAFDHLVSILVPTLPVFDSWTLLAAVAGVTKRARIGLQVTGNPYRHPGMLAKQVVTIHQVGRARTASSTHSKTRPATSTRPAGRSSSTTRPASPRSSSWSMSTPAAK